MRPVPFSAIFDLKVRLTANPGGSQLSTPQRGPEGIGEEWLAAAGRGSESQWRFLRSLRGDRGWFKLRV